VEKFMNERAGKAGEQDIGQAKTAQKSAFERTMKELQEKYERFKTVERALQSEKIRLTQKIPEIEKTLEAVEMLERNHANERETKIKYQLGDAVYAKASIEDPTKVFLWLGANVMLEYELVDAKELLKTNLENCERQKERTDQELAFVKDNATIQEVNLARVYNYEVKRAQEQKKKSLSASTAANAVKA
jgi:prefoldin subunit 5